MSSVPKMSIGEMYSLVTRQEKNWGVQGYEVPKKYFDHIESRKHKDQLEASQRQVTWQPTDPN